MMRMSGQSWMLEQGSGVQGLDEPSAGAGVSFRTGKKVRRSQSCPPPSWSSLASVPTSHRILGSVTKEAHLGLRFNHEQKSFKYFHCFVYLCRLLRHFCFPLTCCSLNTAFLAPGRHMTPLQDQLDPKQSCTAEICPQNKKVIPVWIFSEPFCGCAIWSGWVLRQHLEPSLGSVAHPGRAQTQLSPSAARLPFSTNWSSLAPTHWLVTVAQGVTQNSIKHNIITNTTLWDFNRIFFSAFMIICGPTCRWFVLIFSNIRWPLCRCDSM